MNNKIAIVTGANGGLGTFVTQALLDAGATVVGVSKEIRQSDFNSPAFTALPADLLTAVGATKMVASVIARFGRIHVLAHTVGGFAGGQSIADTDDSTFQRMFDLTSAIRFICCVRRFQLSARLATDESSPSAAVLRSNPEPESALIARRRPRWCL